MLTQLEQPTSLVIAVPAEKFVYRDKQAKYKLLQISTWSFRRSRREPLFAHLTSPPYKSALQRNM